MIEVRVAEVETLNALVRCLRLEHAAGALLPGYAPGAHMRVGVRLPDGAEDWRAYSLIDATAPRDAQTARASYRIAVRLEQSGRGGSRFMHALRVGDTLRIEEPRNDFELQAQASRSVLLVAGGIGVTPLVGMAAHCKAVDIAVRMVYAGRSQALMAFVPELRALLGDALQLHSDEEQGHALDVGGLLRACAPGEQIYLCGPGAMLDAARQAAETLGWPRERLRFESFAVAAPGDADHGFELVLARSGRTLHVPTGQTILDCLEAHGCDPLFDCRRGDCGVCAVPVLEGEPDHRDHVLSAAERASSKVIQICVSRARGGRLVLDM